MKDCVPCLIKKSKWIYLARGKIVAMVKKWLEARYAGWVSGSVSRFGKIFAIWPIFKSLAIFTQDFLVLGKILNLHWHIFDAIKEIFIFENGQIWTNNRAIWSHWWREASGRIKLFAIQTVRKRPYDVNDCPNKIITTVWEMIKAGVKLFQK